MKKALKIGEFSKMVGIPQQTLRYYEELGLLNPKRQDRENGYRFYGQSEFYDVATIKFQKLLGLSLDEIIQFRKIDTIGESLDSMRGYHERLMKEIELKTFLANNYLNIINSIKEKYEKYKKDPKGIYIEECGPIEAFFSKIEGEKDWYEFEVALQNIQQMMPYYDEIGHNYSLGSVFSYKEVEDLAADASNRETSEELVLDNPKAVEKLVPDQVFVCYSTLEKEISKKKHSYPIGKALVAYSFGEDISAIDRVQEMLDYVKEQKLIIRGDVIVKQIIHRFVLYDDKKQLQEIIIPLKNDK